MLLPVVSIFFFFLGWAVGLAYYRRLSYRPLAHIIWGSGVFSTMLILVAVMYIVTSLV
jgi:hypothetical protein